MDLAISVSKGAQRADVAVLRLKGRLNLGNVGILDEEVQKARARGVRYLFFDLAELDSITSAGLSKLLALAKALEGAVPGEIAFGGRKSRFVKLIRPKPEVTNVLTMAGFDYIFEIHDDLGSALASL